MKKLILVCLILTAAHLDSFSQSIVYMTQEEDFYTVPCEVNSHKIKSVFNTSNSDISIPLSEVIYMLKRNLLTEKDLNGSTYNQLIGGHFQEGSTIKLKEIKLGDNSVYDIRAKIISSPYFLIGNSLLKEMGIHSIDFKNNKVTLGNNEFSINTSASESNSASPKSFNGTGEFDNSSYGIFGRKVVKRNFRAIPMNETGTCTVKVCIDREGSVVFSEIIEEKTTITNESTLSKILVAAKGYKYEPNARAPKEQCGKLIIKLSGTQIPQNRY